MASIRRRNVAFDPAGILASAPGRSNVSSATSFNWFPLLEDGSCFTNSGYFDGDNDPAEAISKFNFSVGRLERAAMMHIFFIGATSWRRRRGIPDCGRCRPTGWCRRAGRPAHERRFAASQRRRNGRTSSGRVSCFRRTTKRSP